jgi:hypothetical protein
MNGSLICFVQDVGEAARRGKWDAAPPLSLRGARRAFLLSDQLQAIAFSAEPTVNVIQAALARRHCDEHQTVETTFQTSCDIDRGKNVCRDRNSDLFLAVRQITQAFAKNV